VISQDGRRYRLDVAYRILEQGIPRDNINCRLRVTIDAYPPDKRKRDLDNIQKALLDAIVAADVIEDDSLIDALSITRHEACEDGKVIVRIQPYAMQDLRC
jgi:crossover junction endodeoxyribonuclease RusA